MPRIYLIARRTASFAARAESDFEDAIIATNGLAIMTESVVDGRNMKVSAKKSAVKTTQIARVTISNDPL
jgi:hypothetical protein